jgi:hypothetical protein
MNRPLHYILADDSDIPIPMDDGFAAWKWMDEHPDRRQLELTEFPDGTHVSTVFLCIDHAHWGGDPILWETMIFSGNEEIKDWTNRYHSAAEARVGHWEAVGIAAHKLGIRAPEAG